MLFIVALFNDDRINDSLLQQRPKDASSMRRMRVWFACSSRLVAIHVSNQPPKGDYPINAADKSTLESSDKLLRILPSNM